MPAGAAAAHQAAPDRRSTRLNAVVVDADRHGRHGTDASAEPDPLALRVDFGIQFVLDGEHEIPAIAFELKRHQIVRQQPGEDLAPPRTDAQPIGIRPRNVPEQRGARRRPPLAQPRRDQREMVVLDEDRRVVVRQFLVDRRSEPVVDGLVRGPVLAAKLRAHIDQMAQRPQTLRWQTRRNTRRTAPDRATADEADRTDCRAARAPCRPASTTARSAAPSPYAIHTPSRSRIRASSATATPPASLATVIAPSAVVVVQIRLAIRHHDQRTPHVGVDLSGTRQSASEQQRTDQLVDRDQRDEQRLHPAAPGRKLASPAPTRARA